MKGMLFLCMSLAMLWPLAGAAVAEPAPSKPTVAAAKPLPTGKTARFRGDKLGEPLDGLARQIAEINANIANLGPDNAAALRFLTVSLAAYQRAWAGLTRDQVDFETGPETVTVAAEVQQ